MIGQTIAHYRVTGKLGEGGMGVVYRALDTKLNREVALKVLPDLFANDAEYMGRFQREAQVLAALNHPHIAAIYGVEDRALVMELVEGETLADRIAQGPISVEEATPIARQIAEAIEAAHEKNIVHRDLKPANVKFTSEGTVKVLDFGIAKTPDAAPVDPVSSPTRKAMSGTLAGMIMGTAAYMAPEQARGLPVDRRADVWAYGAVLFEMLTGKPAFDGETMTDILAAVVRSEPDWNLVPPRMRKLVRRCLTKDKRQRLQAIGEAAHCSG
jgi:serine/threonine protein kinase